MAKRKAARKAAVPTGPLQRLADRAQAAYADATPLVNAFAAQHGSYERAHGIDGQGNINMRPMINRGGTALDRWKAAKLLSETQLAAIAHVDRLWRLVDAGARLTANLDRTIFGCPGDGNMAEIEAGDDLNRIRASFHPTYWDVFENVCRFDEPAGVAGSRLANDDPTRRTMARTIVCLIADHIYMRERLSY
jgi:hypothetical protein